MDKEGEDVVRIGRIIICLHIYNMYFRNISIIINDPGVRVAAHILEEFSADILRFWNWCCCC